METEEYDRTFCMVCMGKLAIKSTGVAKLWVDLVGNAQNFTDLLVVNSRDWDELRKLEERGYIQTHEQPPYLIVKLIGHEVDEDGDVFVCVEGDHEE